MDGRPQNQPGHNKGGVSNVVTDIDIQCQRLIIEECTRCLPESVILAEEEKPAANR